MEKPTGTAHYVSELSLPRGSHLNRYKEGLLPVRGVKMNSHCRPQSDSPQPQPQGRQSTSHIARLSQPLPCPWVGMAHVWGHSPLKRLVVGTVNREPPWKCSQESVSDCLPGRAGERMPCGGVSALQLSPAWKQFPSCHKPAQPRRPFPRPHCASEIVRTREPSTELSGQRGVVPWNAGS